MHEKWARGFEAYLRDGVAPTDGLRAAFERFRMWLTEVYRSVRDLGVTVPDEVGGVMDRMLGGPSKAELERHALVAAMAPNVRAKIEALEPKLGFAVSRKAAKAKIDDILSRHARPLRKSDLPPALREPERRPERFTAWINRTGGVRDDAGELAAMDIRNGAPGVPPGLVRNAGRDFDSIGEAAMEAGFFRERPTVSEVLDAIRDDFDGAHRYSDDDLELVAEWDRLDGLWSMVERSGIDPRFMNDIELMETLGRYSETPDPARAASALEEVSELDGDAALFADLDHVIAESGDFEVPVGAIEVDGELTPDAVMASDLMRQADDDVAAVEAFSGCLTGGAS